MAGAYAWRPGDADVDAYKLDINDLQLILLKELILPAQAGEVGACVPHEMQHEI